MKLLGFYFGRSPNASKHVWHLKRKFWARAWVIRHLKKANVPTPDLIKAYKSLVLPILDYTAVVYHSLLKKSEEKELENLQKGALRIIHGHKTSYEDCLELSGMPTLKNRRLDLVDKFIKKTATNPKYKAWFPKKPSEQT